MTKATSACSLHAQIGRVRMPTQGVQPAGGEQESGVSVGFQHLSYSLDFNECSADDMISQDFKPRFSPLLSSSSFNSSSVNSQAARVGLSKLNLGLLWLSQIQCQHGTIDLQNLCQPTILYPRSLPQYGPRTAAWTCQYTSTPPSLCLRSTPCGLRCW